MKIYISLFLLIIGITNSFGQTEKEDKWAKYQDDYKIKMTMSVQMWNTYTIGQEIWDQEINKYIPAQNRFNTQLRRTRMTFAGTPYPNLKFKITAALDLIGRDVLTATQGGANNGGSPIFRIWNAYADWKIHNKTDLFHVIVGYIPPQIGRESITAALKASSFEKSWSQNYLRSAIVGLGHGRAMGVNFGGQHISTNNPLGFSYDLGVYSPEAFGVNGNSSGVSYAPLVTGRLALYVGEPESKEYTIGHKVNYFGKRKGMTFAMASSHHGQNDLFTSNKALGFDWLINYDNLNFDGEWTFFTRTGLHSDKTIKVSSNTGYFRVGYNIHLKGVSYLEPVIMYVKYNGPLDLLGQHEASIVNTPAGDDEIIDIGVNYHINPKLKISLFYTHNRGDKGEAIDGISFNNYFKQAEVGAIKRGNLIGLGIVGIF